MLTGKVCLVTGAAAGIGRSIAEAYANEGGVVVVTDADLAGAEMVAEAIVRAGGSAVAFGLDVADPDAHERVAGEVRQRFGRLDVACNNAGIVLPRVPIAEMPVADWRRIMSVNLDGVFYGFRAQIPLMATGGVLIAVSSLWGVRGQPEMAHYTAAKHGVIGLVKSASWEYGHRGIRAVAVGPAYIATGLEQNIPADVRAALPRRHALQRLGRPSEVADAIVWLSSPAASFITGSFIPVDGGYLAH